jgi:hypothetical protein
LSFLAIITVSDTKNLPAGLVGSFIDAGILTFPVPGNVELAYAMSLQPVPYRRAIRYLWVQ